MPKEYIPLVVKTQQQKSSSASIVMSLNFTNIINHYEKKQQGLLHFASENYNNPSIRPTTSFIGGGRFFREQLSVIVNDATPNSHFYWFKKLYTFYLNPINQEVLLENAIKQLINPYIFQLKCSLAKFQKMYLAHMMTKGPFIDHVISERSRLHKKIIFFEQEMPSQLIAQAFALNGLSIGRTAATVQESKTPSASI